MLRRCPSKPKPVTSVHALTSCSRAAASAWSLRQVMLATAAASSAGPATPCLIAVPMTPVPSALLSTSTCPARAPRFDSTSASATSPVTDRPNLSSGSRTL